MRINDPVRAGAAEAEKDLFGFVAIAMFLPSRQDDLIR
jgi:hypothetical protein